MHLSKYTIRFTGIILWQGQWQLAFLQYWQPHPPPQGRLNDTSVLTSPATYNWRQSKTSVTTTVRATHIRALSYNLVYYSSLKSADIYLKTENKF